MPRRGPRRRRLVHSDLGRFRKSAAAPKRTDRDERLVAYEHSRAARRLSTLIRLNAFPVVDAGTGCGLKSERAAVDATGLTLPLGALIAAESRLGTWVNPNPSDGAGQMRMVTNTNTALGHPAVDALGDQYVAGAMRLDTAPRRPRRA